MANKPEDSSVMSVQDAIRLKDSLNHSITWGNSNFNALEIENLTKLSAEDYAHVRAEYKKWNVNMFSTIALIVLTLVCGAACIYFHNIWVRSIAISLGASLFYHLAKRDGHA